MVLISNSCVVHVFDRFGIKDPGNWITAIRYKSLVLKRVGGWVTQDIIKFKTYKAIPWPFKIGLKIKKTRLN